MAANPDLDQAVEIIIVDAYGDDEQYTAFLTVIEEQTRLPTTATLLGTPGHGYRLRLHRRPRHHRPLRRARVLIQHRHRIAVLFEKLTQRLLVPCPDVAAIDYGPVPACRAPLARGAVRMGKRSICVEPRESASHHGAARAFDQVTGRP